MLRTLAESCTAQIDLVSFTTYMTTTFATTLDQLLTWLHHFWSCCPKAPIFVAIQVLSSVLQTWKERNLRKILYLCVTSLLDCIVDMLDQCCSCWWESVKLLSLAKKNCLKASLTFCCYALSYNNTVYHSKNDVHLSQISKSALLMARKTGVALG